MFKNLEGFKFENRIVQRLKSAVYLNDSVSEDTKDAFERCTCIPREVGPIFENNFQINELRDHVIKTRDKSTGSITESEVKYIVYTTFPISKDLNVAANSVNLNTMNNFAERTGLFEFRSSDSFIRVYHDIIEAWTTTLDIMRISGFAHTDIKLDNIILGFDDTAYQGVKVIDFGLDFKYVAPGRFRFPFSTEGYPLEITVLEMEKIEFIALQLGLPDKDPFKYFITTMSDGGNKEYQILNPIQLAHYQVLSSLFLLTSKIAFKSEYLFKNHLESNPSFATFVELSQMVLLKWFVDPPERCGPSEFINTAREVLKLLVDLEPAPKLQGMKAISTGLYEHCPTFLHSFSKIMGHH
jgi:hypothetical protein